VLHTHTTSAELQLLHAPLKIPDALHQLMYRVISDVPLRARAAVVGGVSTLVAGHALMVRLARRTS
jgi:uncharacterized membrane protein